MPPPPPPQVEEEYDEQEAQGGCHAPTMECNRWHLSTGGAHRQAEPFY